MFVKRLLPALLFSTAMLASRGQAQQAEQPGSPATPAAGAPAAPAPATAATAAAAPDTSNDIVVTARRLDLARETLLPSLGANEYTLDAVTLTAQPGGLERGFNDVLLTTPGVSQDQYGGYHVRNEHGNLQYRLDGIIVPEPVTGFGQVIDTRFADSIALITGALPAQYGYRTAGVVDIRTPSGQLADKATVGIYGGGYGLLQPSATVQGSSGALSGFGSITYTRNDLGIDNVREGRQAYHDRSEQVKAFTYLSDILSANDRLTAIFGFYEARFEIPDAPGATPNYNLNGQTTFDSLQLNQVQRENNYYGTLALQHSNGDFDLQIAPFFRLSRTRFYPDAVGDLIFNGVADRSRLASDVFGVQVDGRSKLWGAHTLRYGLFYQNETTHSNVDSLVFPVDPVTGLQSSTTPLPFSVAGRKVGNLYGIYAQDEWAPLDKLTINIGARFDRVRAYTNEQQLSPRVNATYKLSDQAALHLGYARDFTPPPQELIGASTVATFAGTTKAPPSSGNDTVKAEREHLVDAGASLTPSRSVNITIDGYYKAKRNLLDEGQFGEALILSPFNYKSAFAYGLELGGNYHAHGLTTYANVAIGKERGKNIVSSQFFFTPAELGYIENHYIFTDHDQRVTASAGASYVWTNGLGKLTASTDALYGSGLRRAPADPAVIDPNGAKLPGYVQVNLGLSQALDRPGVLHGVTLRLDVTNLGDQSYLIRDGSGVGVGLPSYGQRRTILGGITKAF